MTGDARGRILARVRGRTRDQSGAEVLGQRDALGRAPAALPLCANLLENFACRVIANQGSIDGVLDRSAACKAVAAYLYTHHRGHRLMAGNDARLAAMPWRDGGVLPRFGAAEAGEPAAVSHAELGVAETGSVLLRSGRGNPAANNWLSEDHIVLLNADTVVPDFEAAWSTLESDTPNALRGRGLHFISAPSGTADIVGQHVVGAHGPRRWHIVLIGEGAQDAVEQALRGG